MGKRLVSVVSDAGARTITRWMIAFGISAHLGLVWLWPYPPILDWPNHMARYYLEARALSGASIPSGYEINYALMPNLGADLVMPFLLQIFPLTVASRLFLTFDVLICWLGFALFVAREAARSGNVAGASILILPWLLTGTFFSGFLNYTSGIGIAFLAFVNYLRLSERDTASPSQLLLQGGLVALLYIWHLAALGTYVILHFSYFLMHLMRQGRALPTDRNVRRKVFFGWQSLLPAGALIVAQKIFAMPMAVEGGIVWRGPIEKITTALKFVLSYNIAADFVVIALWVGALIAMFRVEQFRLRLMQIDWLHIATLIFFILYLCLPLGLGSTWNVDTRALLPLLICSIALITRLPSRRVVAGAALALIATVVRVCAISVSWGHFVDVNAQHMNFIRQLPSGARVLAISFPEVSRFNNDVYVIAWAVPERQAMVSSLFAIAGQQPLRVIVNAIGPFAQLNNKGMQVDFERVRAASFDYVWCFNPSGKEVAVPAEWARVYALSSITIWKVH